MADEITQHPVRSQPDSAELNAKLLETEAAKRAVDAIVPGLAEARRKYAETRSPESKSALDEIQAEAENRMDRMRQALRELEAASGIPPEILDALSKPNTKSDKVDRIQRAKLTVQEVAPTADIDELLPAALDAIIARLPRGWLDEEPPEIFRLPAGPADEPFSIVKGIRPESEFSGGNRLRQSIHVCEDFLRGNMQYDHFAGSMLVPQLVQLGTELQTLTGMSGADRRLESLWANTSDQVDSTTFELLVAAACANRGRNVEFIKPSRRKSPDIRCHDPFPLVIECKRRAPLSQYERSEEATMREVFMRLEAAAKRLGLSGRFEVTLGVEATSIDGEEVVRRCMLQRLAGRPDRPLSYEWGSVAFHELPHRLSLETSMRPYSPSMLEAAFGWNSDLPEWDGIICKVAIQDAGLLDEVREPIGLLWSNLSSAAVEKRARTPSSLFGSASKQMPGGEIGIVYIAYNEGAREEIANKRQEDYARLLHEWEHSGAFRIPVSFLVRLFPRALENGKPDLIESTVRYLSEPSGGDPWFFEKFPSTVFTPIKRQHRDTETIL